MSRIIDMNEERLHTTIRCMAGMFRVKPLTKVLNNRPRWRLSIRKTSANSGRSRARAIMSQTKTRSKATHRIYNTANVLLLTSNNIKGSWPFDKKLLRTVSLDSLTTLLRRLLSAFMPVFGAVNWLRSTSIWLSLDAIAVLARVILISCDLVTTTVNSSLLLYSKTQDTGKRCFSVLRPGRQVLGQEVGMPGQKTVRR